MIIINIIGRNKLSSCWSRLHVSFMGLLSRFRQIRLLLIAKFFLGLFKIGVYQDSNSKPLVNDETILCALNRNLIL